jgi:hypothetical protein
VDPVTAVLHTYSPGAAEASAVAGLAARRDRESFRRTGRAVRVRAPHPGELGLVGRGWLIRVRLGLGGVHVRQAFRVEPYRFPRGAGAPRVGPHRPTAVDLWNPPSPDAPSWAFEPDDEAAGAPHGASPDGGDR